MNYITTVNIFQGQFNNRGYDSNKTQIMRKPFRWSIKAVIIINDFSVF